MKKMNSLVLLVLLFSCGENTTAVNDISEENVLEEIPELIDPPNPEELIESIITPGSQKSLLIGNWQDLMDTTLTISISSDKYTTYVDGKKNWDNPWDLCNYAEYAPENEDENGKYILVHLKDKSAVFYVQEIRSITENELDVIIVKSSAGSGMTHTFVRL